MTRRTVAAALTGLIVAATGVTTPVAVAADLEGRYAIEGRNPGGQGGYEGQAAVKRQDNVYQVAWKVGQQQYVGTGLRKGDVFSVVYDAPGGDTQAGLAVYEIQDDGTLLGTWTPLGGQNTGTERWTPVDSQ
jgi:hypothetical protein